METPPPSREEHGFRLTRRAAAPAALRPGPARPNPAPAGRFSRTRGGTGATGSVSVWPWFYWVGFLFVGFLLGSPCKNTDGGDGRREGGLREVVLPAELPIAAQQVFIWKAAYGYDRGS